MNIGMGVPKPNHKRKKPEPVEQVILQSRKECWVCGYPNNLDPHHIFGAANRTKSERYGLKVWLCETHHNLNVPGDPGVHFNKELMTRLRQTGQRAFEVIYGHERFMREFGRNYLDGEEHETTSGRN